MCRWLASALVMMFASSAHAHLLNMTKVIVSIDANGAVTVEMQVDLNRAAGGPLEYYRLSRIEAPQQNAEIAPILERLVAAVDLRVDGAALPLQLQSVELPQLPRETFIDPLSWPMSHIVLAGADKLDIDRAQHLQGTLRPTFPFEEPISLTFSLDVEQRTMTRWLVAGQTSPSFQLHEGEAARPVEEAAPSLMRYVVFGFTHILPKGWDHVLFVLGLYLGARSFRSLLILVTSFTVAHSVTLAMASVGVVRLPSSVVEPLIAASIVWIGLENLFIGRATASSRAERWRPLIVFGFGLLHGLGFASALAELRLPAENFLLALLSFNVGIELGQLAVIAIAIVLTIGLRDRVWFRSRVALPASVAIAILAAVWTVQRLTV